MPAMSMIATNSAAGWVGKSYGVVHRRDAGGELAYPGLVQPMSVADGSRFKFVDIVVGGIPLLTAVDLRPNSGRPEMNIGWSACALGIAAPGRDDPVALEKARLPKWDPNDEDVVDEYFEWERNIFEKIRLFGNEKPNQAVLNARRRLEGVIGFYDAGTREVSWDRVRIFRVRNALKEAANGSYDWMAYRFSPLPSSELEAQEGGGHGPPELDP